ncbi:MAG: Hsp20/alpha crystallin family protein [Fimbriimonadaceae bacterium]|nr:Hsp20/alpha crystallin family protein [Chitinophagales bacterium]
MTMLSIRKRPQGVPTLFNVFEDFFNSNFPEKFMEDRGTFIPSVNVTESEKNYKIEFAVPGFTKQDFNVDIEKDYITVSGKKEDSKETTEGKYTRKEFSSGSFKRTFSIPENTDSEKIDAVYENGILNLILPKKETKIENSIKKIEVK